MKNLCRALPKLSYSLVAMCLVFASCEKPVEPNNNNNTTNSEFQGEWSGTFSGDDNGTWSAGINSNGDVSGTAYSIIFADNYSLEGSVSSSGQFQATFGTSSAGGEFTGQLNGNSGSGTWVNTGAMMNGSWSGSKDQKQLNYEKTNLSQPN